jgi:hypothetical protein
MKNLHAAADEEGRRRQNGNELMSRVEYLKMSKF